MSKKTQRRVVTSYMGNIGKLTGRVLPGVALALISSLSLQQAHAVPAALSSPNIAKYLVIGTGEGSTGNEFAAFQMSNVEIGADQELVSNSDVGAPSQQTFSFTGGLDLTGDFVTKDGAEVWEGVGNRWNDVDPDHPDDTVGIPDELPGARPVFEGIDFSGNVAITGELAKFESSNADVYATDGIECNRAAAGCFPNPSSPNSYIPGAEGEEVLGPTPSLAGREENLNNLNGVSQFDPTALLDDMEAARDYIVGLTADTTITSNIENENHKDGSGPFITDLDAIDAAGNNDGIAVIDIDVGNNSFLVNNSDWILQTTMDTFVIFRMKKGTQYDFANSSIVLGDGIPENPGPGVPNSTNTVRDLGAIFFMDAFKGTNELFNNNNVILNGIGLWDFTDFNPNRSQLLSSAASEFSPPVGDTTVINLQNAQGCAQFISHQVLMSNNRWNRCAAGGGEVPLPGSLALLLGGLGTLLLSRRRWPLSPLTLLRRQRSQ